MNMKFGIETGLNKCKRYRNTYTTSQ